jgi:hypothetical protein
MLQERRKARLAELEAADRAAAQAGPRPGADARGDSGSDSQPDRPSGLRGWLSSFAWAGGGGAAQPQPSPAQLARRAAAAREQRVRSELGAPPEPPAAPRGIYVHGSVGSGKSMTMDMFYEAAVRTVGLQHARR